MVGFIISLVIAVVLLIVLMLMLAYILLQRSWLSRISYIPLRAEAMMSVIDALDLDESSVLADLGCGDGRILKEAHEACPETKLIGVEHHPFVRALARRRLRGIPTEIRGGDLLHTDLSGVNRVFTYLNISTMAQLEPKLERELPKGARLVSCDFILPNKAPSQTIKIGAGHQLGQTLYVYDF